MVKLFCGIVRVAGSAFSVKVDERDSVDDLKDAIWKKIKAKFENNESYKSVIASDLKLFLARKERRADQEEEGEGEKVVGDETEEKSQEVVGVGAVDEKKSGDKKEWLTELDVKKGVKDTTGLELLDAARAKLRSVGLSNQDVGGVDEEEEIAGSGPVNVLVEVPSRSSEKRELGSVSEGFSTRKMGRADTLLRDLWGYPHHEALTRGLTADAQQLNQILEYPWPFKLPTAIGSDVVAFNELFDQRRDEIECNNLYDILKHTWFRLSHHPGPSASEDEWHTYYDALLVITMDMLGVKGREMSFARNRCDKTGTTIQTKRPDVIMHYNGLVLLRGEEKCRREGIQKPLRELTDKMYAWSPILYGELSWTLGYATSGETLHIVKITRDRRVQTILPINSIIKQKAYAIQVFYNLSFVMEKMISVADWHPNTGGLLPFKAQTEDKRTLELQDDRIVRTMSLQQCGTEDNFERLAAVYRTLESVSSTSSSTVTHLQTVLSLDVKYETDAEAEVKHPSRIIVGLSPLGMDRRPQNEKEVRQWLREMLVALTYWHGAGYCHGDIRQRNIVYVPIDADSGYWVLIDMDESYLPNTKKIDWKHQSKGEILCFRHDLLQLGKLLKEWMILFEETTSVVALRPIQEELVATSNPDLSAEDVLARMENVL